MRTAHTADNFQGIATPDSAYEPLFTSWARSLRARNRSDRTVTSYLESGRQFVAFLESEGRSTDPADATRADVEDFVVRLLDTRSANTARIRFASLQQFFKWATAEGEVDSDPMAGMGPPSLPSRPVPVFTEAELKALLATVENKKGFEPRRDTALLWMFTSTGVRLGEMAGLRVADIDLDAGAALVIGKGDRGRYVTFGSKTVLALDRYMRERSRHPHATSEWLWLGGKGRLTDSGITQVLRRRAADAGVGQMHAHRFRHTFAHRWLANGGTEGGLQTLAGWRSPQMLARYGASAKAERAAAEAHRLHLEDL